MEAGQAAGTKPILLPQSAVPPQVKTDLTFQSSVLRGAAQQAVAGIGAMLDQAGDSLGEAFSDVDAMGSRALDFLNGGDYQKALLQAYLASYTIDCAKYRAQMQAPANV
jgi:hypothetical protein